MKDISPPAGDECSNRQALVANIHSHYHRANGYALEAIRAAILCGDAFLELKSTCDGDFMAVADRECPEISRATRNRFMQAAAKKSLLSDYSSGVMADSVSLRGFLRFDVEPVRLPYIPPPTIPSPERKVKQEKPEGEITLGEECENLVSHLAECALLGMMAFGETNLNPDLDMFINRLVKLVEAGDDGDHGCYDLVMNVMQRTAGNSLAA